MNPLLLLGLLAWFVQTSAHRRRRNPSTATQWYAYRDSEAPGVRRASIGAEPPYSKSDRRAALEWASRAKWGAMRIDYPKRGSDPEALPERDAVRYAGLGTPSAD